MCAPCAVRRLPNRFDATARWHAAVALAYVRSVAKQVFPVRMCAPNAYVTSACSGVDMRTPHLLITTCTAGDPDGPYRHAELAIWDDVDRSLTEYPRTWSSAEEGAMILGEEVDELWDEVRHDQIGRARAEAAQVGAMALRFIADVCERTGDSAKERCRVAVNEQRAARLMVGPLGRVLSSSHEGFGFLKREYDALWAATTAGCHARVPAGRVAATAVRFIAEITYTTTVMRVAR